MNTKPDRGNEGAVVVKADGEELEGMLEVPAGATGIVLFAHGSGSSRHSPRNNAVAADLRRARIGTLLFDLLTEKEDVADRQTRRFRFDIELLTRRLLGATQWLSGQDRARELPFGYFGASTGAAAALKAAARKPMALRAVVSRGGRPDLAEEALAEVAVPVRLIVGGLDTQVIAMNESALARLASEHKEIEIVESAGHLFEEPGKMDEVSALAREWFTRWFAPGC